MVEVLPFLLGSVCTILSYQFYRVGRRLLPYLTPSHPISHFRPNNFVLLAGCTDGIGLALAREVAQRKATIIAIGRNKQKLTQLQRKYPGTITIQVDFSGLSLNQINYQPILSIITKQLSDRQGSKILGFINSVGVAHFSTYDKLTQKQISNVHNTNLNSLHFLMKLSLLLSQNLQLSSKPFFINVSSAVGQHPQKYSTVYAASKAYLSNFLTGLRQQHTDYTFLDVRPWYVRTKMVGYQQSWDTVEPREIAQGTFKVLGKKNQCNGCWKHELIDQFEWTIRQEMSLRLQQKMERALRLQELRKNRKKKE